MNRIRGARPDGINGRFNNGERVPASRINGRDLAVRGALPDGINGRFNNGQHVPVPGIYGRDSAGRPIEVKNNIGPYDAYMGKKGLQVTRGDYGNPLGQTNASSLEQRQSIHNAYISAAPNVSASNEMFQQRHDMNEQLIRGAELLGKGRVQGLNDDQILQAAMQQHRRVESQSPNILERDFHQTQRTNVADIGILKEITRRQR